MSRISSKRWMFLALLAAPALYAQPTVTAVAPFREPNPSLSATPGMAVTISGSGLGPAQVFTNEPVNGVISTLAAGTEVLVNGANVPVYQTQATSVTAIIPYGVSIAAPLSIVVRYQGVDSSPLLRSVTSIAPVIWQSGGQPVTAGSRRRLGTLAIFGLGGGQSNPASTAGVVNAASRTLVAPVTVTLGGVPCTVTRAAIDPSVTGALGYFSLEFIVAASVPLGTQPIMVTVNGIPAQAGLTIPISDASTLSTSAPNMSLTAFTPASASSALTVSSVGDPQNFSAVVSTNTNGTWLRLDATSGTTPRVINVTADASADGGLAAGTYNGTIIITSATAGNSPLQIPVTFTVCSATLSPPSVAVGAGASSGTLTVTASGCSWTGDSDAGWLRKTGNSGNSGNGTISYAVDPNPSPLPRQGRITLSPSQRSSVFTQAGAVLTGAPSQFTFQSTGTTTGVLNIGSSGATLNYNAAATTASGGNWLRLDAASGETPGTLTVTAVPDGLTAGVYTGSVLITATSPGFQPLTIPVTFTVGSCNLTVSPSSLSPSAAGAAGTIQITAPNGCAWTAAANASWLRITSAATGTGNGSVTYQVDANTSAAARQATLTIGNQTIAVTQPQGACQLTLTPGSATFSSAAAASEITVVASTPSCSWTAETASPFLSLTSGTTGTGSGTIRYAVQAFAGGSSPRTGTITISGQPFSVTQNPQVCSFTLSAASLAAGAAGASGRFTVNTASGCGWNAAASAPFVTLTSGANGSVSGEVAFTVAPNTGPARTAAITAGGQAFLITQAGTDCTATFDPPEASFAATGSLETTVRVNTPCVWTAAAGSPFLSIVRGASGTGPGDVTYRVQPATADREGSLTIAGRAFRVTQRRPVCEFSLSRSAHTFPSTGGSTVVDVHTATECLSQITVQNAPTWVNTEASAPLVSPRAVLLSAPSNTGAERSATLLIGNQPFTLVQAAANTFRCRPRTPAVAQVRSEGQTEKVSDVVLDCSGASDQALRADVLVTFNTPFTSKAIGSATDALLLLNDPTSPQLGVNAFQGIVAGGNAVRFPEIPLAAAGPNSGLVVRMTNLRVDAARPNLGDITAEVRLQAPVRVIPVETPSVVVARHSPGLQTTIGSAVAVTGGFRIPVTFRELMADAFRPRTVPGQDPSTPGSIPASESGFVNTVRLGSEIGFADTGTRLVLRLRGVPVGLRVFAPLLPEGGQAAQLVSDDPNGVGIGFPAGVPGNPLVEVPVRNGEATLTWEVIAANPAAIESYTFPLVVSQALDSGTLTASFGPFRALSQGAARQPTPGFRNPSAPAQRAPVLRTLLRAESPVIVVPAAERRSPTGNRSVRIEVSMSCDSPEGCDDPRIRGNVSPGASFQNCEAVAAESCGGSGRDFEADYRKLDPGQIVTAIIGAELLADAPGRNEFRLSVTASSGVTMASSEVAPCLTGSSPLPAPPAGGSRGELQIYACGPWTITSPVPWITFVPSSGTGDAIVRYEVAPNASGVARNASFNLLGSNVVILQPPGGPPPSSGLRFVPITPCRLLETRPIYAGTTWTGANGPPALVAGATRTLQIAGGPRCGIPASAKAFMLNATIDTLFDNTGPVDVVTLWPAGETRPDFWTLRTTTGGYIANSAIVKAGSNGSIGLYASQRVHMALDVSGYFTDDGSGLLFYPMNSCRPVDTRTVNYYTPPIPPPYGSQRMQAQETRTLRLPGSTRCQIPAAPAYSLQFTLTPGITSDDGDPVAYLSAWPAGAGEPPVSLLNSYFGYVSTNSAIVPASANGSIQVKSFNATNFLIDINGYFGLDDGTGNGLTYYPVTQCRVLDTRNAVGPFGGPQLTNNADRELRLPQSTQCPGLPATARAWALNATLLPSQPVAFLSLWQAGVPWPSISQVNAFQGQTVSNAAIVPGSSNGGIQIKTSNPTHAAVEVVGYFARP